MPREGQGSTSHAIFLCSWDVEIDDSLVGQLTIFFVAVTGGWKHYANWWKLYF